MSAAITEEDPMEERVRRVLQNAQRRDAMCLVYDGGTVPNAPRLGAFVSVDGESFFAQTPDDEGAELRKFRLDRVREIVNVTGALGSDSPTEPLVV
jgi:hypothetical protein